jgi:serine protease AprX
MRRFAIVISVLAVSSVLAVTLFVHIGKTATDETIAPAIPPEKTPPGLGDRDRDGLSDALAAKIDVEGLQARFEVIVTFDGPGDPASAQAAVGPFRVKRELGIIHGFVAEMTGAQAQALARSPGVFRVEENVEVTIFLAEATADYRADAAFDSGYDGAGLGVCIIDTGADGNHVDIGPKIPAVSPGVPAGGFCNALAGGCNVDSAGSALPDADLTAFDDHSHGTHVAGIAAGSGAGDPNYRGVAPALAIYAAKALDGNGSGTLADIMKGINWCAGQFGVHAINMSIGTVGNSDGKSSMDLAADCAVDMTANSSCNLAYAGRTPKIVVVSNGNSGPGLNTVGSPAAAEMVIAVGALAPAAVTDDWPEARGQGLAPYSSRGPTADGRVKPEIVAPGTGITAPAADTINGYKLFDGTSMASPYVAGTVGLMIQAKLAAEGRTGEPLVASDVDAIKTALYSSAEDRGPVGQDNDFGHGVVDTERAITFAEGASSSLAEDPGVNLFAVAESFTPSIMDNQDWRQLFTVQPGEAIMVTVHNPQSKVCLFFFGGTCLIWETTFSDFEAKLWDETGTLVDMSQCFDGEDPNSGVRDPVDPTITYCGDSSGYGRSETLYALNNGTAAASFEVEVYPWNGDAYDDQNSATVEIVVTRSQPVGAAPPTNTPPVANSQGVTTDEDTSVAITLAASDTDGDGLTYTVTGGPSHGSLSGTAPALAYTPNADYNGPDGFTFVANDGTVDSNTATVSITVNPVNDAPVVVDDGPFDTSEDIGITIAVLANDLDPDGDVLSVTSVTNGSNGIATLSGNNVIYTPNVDWNGTDNFTYTVWDGNGGTGNGAVTVNVLPVNDPPAPPSDLTASLETTGKGKNKVVIGIALNWTDNSDNEDGFVIQRCAVSGKGKNKVCNFADIGSVGPDVTTFSDGPAGGTVKYRVRASNANGDSAYSNEVQVRT